MLLIPAAATAVLLFCAGTAAYFFILTGPSRSALLDAPRTNEGMRKSKNEDDDAFLAGQEGG